MTGPGTGQASTSAEFRDEGAKGLVHLRRETRDGHLSSPVAQRRFLRLLRRALVAPADAATMRAYLAWNVGDHAAAAVGNLLAAPRPGPRLDRAVHYDRLSAESVAELDALARSLAEAALQTVNQRAQALQDRDAAAGALRFRFGAYTHVSEAE